jgi:SAM-dependent methyltransferase
MSSLVQVRIHPSQFPEQIQRDLLASLRDRQVKHKFHYDSVQQTHKWLALHQMYSPSRTDPDCEAIYHSAFAAAADRTTSPRVAVVGLGCGGGQKDARLLRLLAQPERQLIYLPCDVSTAMVLVAQSSVSQVISDIQPVVFDLATANDLPAVLNEVAPRASARIVTFFGMIPNFEPRTILPRLAALLTPQDYLLFSANLAPGADYDTGVRKILPQYDNPMTRDWLATFLFELGVERTDGEIHFEIEACPQGTGAKRVAAFYQFRVRRILEVAERFEFQPEDTIRLFYSYRWTANLMERLLREYAIAVLDRWITRSGEEGVFLCTKAA